MIRLVGLGSDLRSDLLAVLVEADTWGRSAVAAAVTATNTHDLAVDGAGDTVLDYTRYE